MVETQIGNQILSVFCFEWELAISQQSSSILAWDAKRAGFEPVFTRMIGSFKMRWFQRRLEIKRNSQKWCWRTLINRKAGIKIAWAELSVLFGCWCLLSSENDSAKWADLFRTIAACLQRKHLIDVLKAHVVQLTDSPELDVLMFCKHHSA